ncbi:unnamed protein product [Linum tenue]|uniref:Uncharacterized protein n=1 Tax=Linum tenue TaxID=586396 RepID=A0AAV0RRI6_9ROSI|nr:unnamed protein product [Linum tenue]
MLLASTLFSYREESCEAVKDDVKGPACRNVNCCLGVVEKDGVTFASGSSHWGYFFPNYVCSIVILTTYSER